MKKIHLLSTSAHFNDTKRINDYVVSYNILPQYIENISTISILETISKEKLDYLENTKFNVYYSGLDNSHINKGYNWLYHIENFLVNNESIGEKDLIIFLTGRYQILNNNMFELIKNNMLLKNYKIIAKDDGDIYPKNSDGSGVGVHTFYMCFEKEIFLNFSKWYKINGTHTNCLEHELKKYMLLNTTQCLVLPKTTILGVETNQVNGSVRKKV